MALTPKNNSSDTPDTPKLSAEDEVALREIDEAVRQDDAAEFIKNYGVAIGSVLALVLLSLGGYLFWNSQVESGLEAQSEEIVSVIDHAQSEDFTSVKTLTTPLLDTETAGVRTSARLLQAAAAIETDDPARAVELYAQVASDEQAPQALRDIARLREVATNYDEREPEDIIAKLSVLAQPGNAFFASAAEMTAIAHLEAGNREEAGALFATIAKDENAPQSLRDRALQMTGQLGVDAIENVEELLGEQGITPQSGGPSVPLGAGPAQ